MTVYEAVNTRRAVRRFAPTPVPAGALERVLTSAARSPSGGNLQPWTIYALTGERLAELKRRTAARIAAGDRGDAPEFDMYPSPLQSPYRDRQVSTREARYASLGLPPDDAEGRRQFVIGNWSCFGAPAALFCYIDRDMGAAQWMDLGMYLQTVMLLLRGEGLHSCTQIAWSVYRRTVTDLVSAPANLLLVCGMSIGYEDAGVAAPRVERAPLAETVTFLA